MTTEHGHEEVSHIIADLTPGELRGMLLYVSGYDPELFARALEAVRRVPPEDDPPPLSRDLSGDLDAIPSSRIGDPAPLPGHECNDDCATAGEPE